jgi:transporter family protein
MGDYKWVVFGLAGAGFAAIVNVLSKSALKATDVFVALSLQSLLMLTTLCVSVSVMGRWGAVRELPRWAVGMLVLSGVAGGLSWTFGYQALQLSNVAKAGTIDKLSIAFAVCLAVVFLKERPSLLNWVGIALMLVGAYCAAHQAAKQADAAAGQHEPHRTASNAGPADATPERRPG